MKEYEALKTDNTTYPIGFFEEPEDYEEPLFNCMRCGWGIFDGDTYWKHESGEEICETCFDEIAGECLDWMEEIA